MAKLHLPLLLLFCLTLTGVCMAVPLSSSPPPPGRIERFQIVENLSSPASVRELVATTRRVHGVWRRSALVDVSRTEPLTHLPVNATASAVISVGAGVSFPFSEYRLEVALDGCEDLPPSAQSHVLYQQKEDNTCIIASPFTYKDLDTLSHRQNILPILSEPLHPQSLAPPPSRFHLSQSDSFSHPANVATVEREGGAMELLRTDKEEEVITKLLAMVSVEEQTKHLQQLTHNFNTRLSSTPELKSAANWLKTQFEQAGLHTRFFSYSTTYAPVVEAVLPGTNPHSIVIIGAHLDDRSKNISDPNVRAPGANDDGSGIAMLLELALVLARAGVRFEHSIHLMAFTGEEQGLFGSKAYAAELKRMEFEVVAMIQGDMLAVRAVGQSAKMAIATQYSTPWMKEWLETITAKFVRDLIVETTDSCCTDQMPFFAEGYPAIAVNEAGGYLIDPMYHNTGDVVERDDYSVEQISLISRVILAAAATAAKPVV